MSSEQTRENWPFKDEKNTMMFISFAWTTQVYLDGKKTETRRFWSRYYADMFWRTAQRNNGYVKAYDKNPRFGGKPIGLIKLVCKPFKQSLSLVTDEDEKAEGGLWGNAQAYIRVMGGPSKTPYVVRFVPLPRWKDETGNLLLT